MKSAGKSCICYFGNKQLGLLPLSISLCFAFFFFRVKNATFSLSIRVVWVCCCPQHEFVVTLSDPRTFLFCEDFVIVMEHLPLAIFD